MLCHAKALFPASTNSGGTSRRACTACLSAARSVSSAQLLATMLTPRLPDLDVLGLVAENGDEMLRMAQPVQAAGPHRADAAHRHTQCRADVYVGGRRITHKHREQLMADPRQLGERGPERGIAFRCDDLLLDRRGGRIWWHLVLRRQTRVFMSAYCPQHPQAFAFGRCRQPARQCRWLAPPPHPLHQQQPDVLADVSNVLTAQLVAGADGPHQRGGPLDELIPRILVAAAPTGDP